MKGPVKDYEKVVKQDLVFSVKLQFGKTLVSVQNKFVLQKDFCSEIFGPKTNVKFQENFLLQNFFMSLKKIC